MAKNKENEYLVGDEVTIKGVLTHVGDNGGNPEYTVAVNNEDTARPISVPARVAPQAFANDQSEVLRLNAEQSEKLVADAEEAEKEREDERDADEVDGGDSPADVRAKTVTPDPAKTPAGNASALHKPVTQQKK